MANLVRSAKSGSDWTRSDLDAYNILVHVEDTATFFGIPDLPQPQVDPEILNIESAENMIVDKNAELINLLDIAMVPTGPEESAVDDFAVELFKTLGYVRRNRVARTRKDIPLLICGEQRHAKTDVCIVDRSQNDILLLVQEDKRFGDEKITDAEAQLIAEAIAAFSLNNSLRRDVGLPELDSKVLSSYIFPSSCPDSMTRLCQGSSCWAPRRHSTKSRSQTNSCIMSAMEPIRLTLLMFPFAILPFRDHIADGVRG
jgi:hypothetical protein